MLGGEAAPLWLVVCPRTGDPRMAKVEIDAKAPDFELPDYQGAPFSLAGHRGMANVLLVFNRGFM